MKKKTKSEIKIDEQANQQPPIHDSLSPELANRFRQVLIANWRRKASEYQKIAVNGHQTADSAGHWNEKAELLLKCAEELEQEGGEKCPKCGFSFFSHGYCDDCGYEDVGPDIEETT